MLRGIDIARQITMMTLIPRMTANRKDLLFSMLVMGVELKDLLLVSTFTFAVNMNGDFVLTCEC